MTGKEFLRIGKDSLFKDIKSKEKNINTDLINKQYQGNNLDISKFNNIINDNWITELYSKSDSFRRGFPFTPLYCFEDQNRSYQICIYKNVNNKFKVFISKAVGEYEDKKFVGLYLDNVNVEFDVFKHISLDEKKVLDEKIIEINIYNK